MTDHQIMLLMFILICVMIGLRIINGRMKAGPDAIDIMLMLWTGRRMDD
jgi:hypothetical protein